MVRQQTPFRFTEREMDIAKGTDLPDLLTHLGYQVRRSLIRRLSISLVV